MNMLQETLNSIKPLSMDLQDKTQKRLDNLTKPPGSLGRLEELARRYVTITGNEYPKIKKKVIYTFAGDHGVTQEGVSAYPKEVTYQMVFNFLRGGAGINVLASHAGAEVRVVDIGVDYMFEDAKGLIKKKIGMGTQNMALRPAMRMEECIRSLKTGIELAYEAHKEGADIIGTGDMGIGNTTPSSAITAVLTGKPVEQVTGRGTGINDDMFKNKIRVIEQSIAVNKPDARNPLDVLAKVGGFEIAGIAGLIIGAAACRIPVVIDGFISSAAALVAVSLKEEISQYLFASHLSVENGHQAILERIGIVPLFDLNLRLGEGTGACLAISLIEAGVKILTEMATFGEAGVSGGKK
ncbi:MAG: nicotinate-nucleotide--dimethylbenzimidazole phosphoribosyltransferase [Nitrospirae bacterium]|nr:nicotinate-nucleotide--dimethylbenzimidazole phosphoribosyltransferase [Nitrospirota bacterium]